MLPNQLRPQVVCTPHGKFYLMGDDKLDTNCVHVSSGIAYRIHQLSIITKLNKPFRSATAGEGMGTGGTSIDSLAVRNSVESEL